MSTQKILKAGEIAKQVREYANSIVKPNVPLLEIAEKIESKIIELGGKPAFPTSLSINEIAAHSTPSHDDETLAHGLLKIDFGVQIGGWLADTAFSVDLENNEENKKLIQTAEEALENAMKIISSKIQIGQIGKTIQEAIESKGFNPIVNLSGHQMKNYDLHAGLTIPNIDNKSKTEINEGLYAVEPFATTGSGRVHEGKPSGIYTLVDSKNIRSQFAREVLDFISEEYQTLPFCSRWLVKKFGTKSRIALKQLEENGNLRQFPQLIESSFKKVSQAEHTILLEKNKKTITTK
jgi:methionyl aminopeptidase